MTKAPAHRGDLGVGRRADHAGQPEPRTSYVLSSERMMRLRTILTTIIVAVAILGPTLFMASAPCLDCDGVCGVAVTHAPLEVRVVRFVLPLLSDSRAEVPPAPLLLSELPPRPLFRTV